MGTDVPLRTGLHWKPVSTTPTLHPEQDDDSHFQKIRVTCKTQYDNTRFSGLMGERSPVPDVCTPEHDENDSPHFES